MKKILLVGGIIVLLIWIVVSKSRGGLIGPSFMQQNGSKSTPTPIATPNAPKSFNFDASTDLKAELEKVNPQVLDSDFE